MSSIRKHRDKYQVRIRRTGFPTITKTFHKLSDAKEWARHQERQADRGELGPDRKQLDRITLAELVTRYRNEVVPAKKGAEIETIILDAFLRHPVCKKRLSDLTTADFASYRDERLRTISGKSLKRQLSPVSNMFEVARTDWKIPLRHNPLSELSVKANDNKRERRLRPGEFDKLLEAARKLRNPYTMIVVRFALETGMRRSEILALRFGDIDLERQIATVRESKNGYSRIIPLSPTATTILDNVLAKMSADARAENRRLFPTTPLALRLSWDRLTKRAKIEDLHFHDLRHEAISRLFELGLTVPEVASISGHRDVRMLLRYAHASLQTIRRKFDRHSCEGYQNIDKT
ncbi:site-specific integrase [Mesorhizobium sp. YM1C-6-2]|uniref:site-specific integrase n=1 Tax=Mesorhizobium sp. YM1C-6-2 TaxID=1827501 RepID=UPI000EF1D3D6|nr:site-specific integrase [Mesorhizobium sp. YM1C-6-2]RLP27267.1 site-specific integrase [Mesorhizobium sp. YM1C-6-2]